MNRKKQNRAPYVEAVMKYISEHNTVFDVPGHHEGEIKTDLSKIYSSKIFIGDINCPRGFDNIAKPNGVLKQAQDLMAEACKAKSCRFLINGSTSGNLIMILSTMKANEKIILPRNVHKSVINALILSGAVPVFIMPELDERIEVVNQISYEVWKKYIDDNLDAKAIFIINPTYFGATCDLKKIVKYAHKKGMVVLVDEAHGSHFYFDKNLPITAMEAGADMATLSIHKTGGSLTQSSVLLIGSDRVSSYDINKAFTMITSTSPSTILLASIDAARKFLVTKGRKKIENAIFLASYAREEISKIPGFIPRGKDHFVANGSFDYDTTKLVIEIDKLDINGFELYGILKDKYHVQVELTETYVFLCIISIGTTKEDVAILIDALKSVSKDHFNPNIEYENRRYLKNFPEMAVRPRSAFHAPLKVVRLEDAENEICKDMIMIYPPGIPIIIPGEYFSKEVIRQILYYRSLDTTIFSDYDDGNVSVVDKENWKLNEEVKDDD